MRLVDWHPLGAAIRAGKAAIPHIDDVRDGRKKARIPAKTHSPGQAPGILSVISVKMLYQRRVETYLQVSHSARTLSDYHTQVELILSQTLHPRLQFRNLPLGGRVQVLSSSDRFAQVILDNGGGVASRGEAEVRVGDLRSGFGCLQV
jgi:hypothetical protein